MRVKKDKIPVPCICCICWHFEHFCSQGRIIGDSICYRMTVFRNTKRAQFFKREGNQSVYGKKILFAVSKYVGSYIVNVLFTNGVNNIG